MKKLKIAFFREAPQVSQEKPLYKTACKYTLPGKGEITKEEGKQKMKTIINI